MIIEIPIQLIQSLPAIGSIGLSSILWWLLYNELKVKPRYIPLILIELGFGILFAVIIPLLTIPDLIEFKVTGWK
jgi:hypothetical protein